MFCIQSKVFQKLTFPATPEGAASAWNNDVENIVHFSTK